MKIYRKKDKIIFEIPAKSKRHNPYMPDDYNSGEYPTLIGLITKDRYGNQELGFAKMIDMDYKDKGDQWTDILIHYWHGDKKSFIEKCKELDIEVIIETPFGDS